MFNTPNDDNLGSLADMMTNLLGVFILVLLVIIMGKGMMDQTASVMADDDRSTVVFRESHRETFRPYSDLFIVAEGRLALWDREETVQALLGNPSALKLQVPSGVVYLFDDGHSRDIDTYSLKLEIDRQWLERKPLWSAGDLEPFLETRRKAEGRCADFFVFPSGMSLFAGMFPSLLEKNIRFRWLEAPPVRIYRNKDQFNVALHRYQ